MINHHRYLYWTIGGDENDRRTNQGAARGAGLDTGRACPADEHYAQRRQLVGTGAFHAVSCMSGCWMYHRALYISRQNLKNYFGRNCQKAGFHVRLFRLLG